MDKDFFKKLVLGLGLCAALVTLCYFFFDKPISFAMAKVPRYFLFKKMNQIAMGIRIMAICALVAMGITKLFKPLSRKKDYLFTFSLALVSAIYVKDWLKVIFGRYWPATWASNNPSLLKDQAYGFHFWQWDSDLYGSFPSGHMVVVCCALTFLWVLAPRWRIFALFIGLLQTAALLTLNYHFLGDIIAGGFVGSACALLAIHYKQWDAKLKDRKVGLELF